MTSSIAAKTSRFETSPTPKAPREWRLTLQDIKLLYIQRQYKRCVARSSDILNTVTTREPIHPVYKTYLYFYSAISYEAMGRYAHNYSTKKLPLLHSALDCFVTCLAVLPSPVPLPLSLPCSGPCYTTRQSRSLCYGSCRREEESERSELSLSSEELPSRSPSSQSSHSNSYSHSPTDSLVSSITDIIDRTLKCPDDDPFLSDVDKRDDEYGDEEDVITKEYAGTGSQTYHYSIEEQEQEEALNEKEEEKSLFPSPLHVRKPSELLSKNPFPGSSLVSRPTQRDSERDRNKLPLPLPIKILPFNSNPNPNTELPTPAAPNPTAYLTSVTCSYNTSITSLHTQINTSISNLHTIIATVTAIQQARAASRSSSSSSSSSSTSSGSQFPRSISFWTFSPVKEKEKEHEQKQKKVRDTASVSRRPGDGPRRTSSRANVLGRRTSLLASSSSSISSSTLGISTESLEDRIVRLRAEGWETVGLRNGKRGWKGTEYYTAFCAGALDELYLGV